MLNFILLIKQKKMLNDIRKYLFRMIQKKISSIIIRSKKTNKNQTI